MSEGIVRGKMSGFPRMSRDWMTEAVTGWVGIGYSPAVPWSLPLGLDSALLASSRGVGRGALPSDCRSPGSGLREPPWPRRRTNSTNARRSPTSLVAVMVYDRKWWPETRRILSDASLWSSTLSIWQTVITVLTWEQVISKIIYCWRCLQKWQNTVLWILHNLSCVF